MPFGEEELDPHGECAEEIVRLRNALTKVRQELWVDYCLHMGRTDTNPEPFNSKPHIRIIDSALGE